MNKQIKLPKIVEVDLSDVIDNDLEGFLDLLSERAVNSPLLMDISYRIVGHDGDTLKIEVDGDTSALDS